MRCRIELLRLCADEIEQPFSRPLLIRHILTAIPTLLNRPPQRIPVPQPSPQPASPPPSPLPLSPQPSRTSPCETCSPSLILERRRRGVGMSGDWGNYLRRGSGRRRRSKGGMGGWGRAGIRSRRGRMLGLIRLLMEMMRRWTLPTMTRGGSIELGNSHPLNRRRRLARQDSGLRSTNDSCERLLDGTATGRLSYSMAIATSLLQDPPTLHRKSHVSTNFARSHRAEDREQYHEATHGTNELQMKVYSQQTNRESGREMQKLLERSRQSLLDLSPHHLPDRLKHTNPRSNPFNPTSNPTPNTSIRTSFRSARSAHNGALDGI